MSQLDLFGLKPLGPTSAPAPLRMPGFMDPDYNPDAPTPNTCDMCRGNCKKDETTCWPCRDQHARRLQAQCSNDLCSSKAGESGLCSFHLAAAGMDKEVDDSYGSSLEVLTLIACGKEKTPFAACAMDLYNGQLFTARKTWAEKNSGDWQILSAEHGLVDPTQVLEPYDLAISQLSQRSRQLWAEDVFEQIAVRFNPDQILIHAGAAYAEHLIPLLREEFGCAVEWISEGLQVGEQLAQLKALNASPLECPHCGLPADHTECPADPAQIAADHSCLSCGSAMPTFTELCERCEKKPAKLFHDTVAEEIEAEHDERRHLFHTTGSRMTKEEIADLQANPVRGWTVAPMPKREREHRAQRFRTLETAKETHEEQGGFLLLHGDSEFVVLDHEDQLAEHLDLKGDALAEYLTLLKKTEWDETAIPLATREPFGRGLDPHHAGPLEIECDYCKAPRLSPCRTKSGGPTGTHKARFTKGS